MPDPGCLNILFLPRWYPNRYDPMPGLFIQRQAEALAASNHVVVLYVHPDPDCPSEFEIEYTEERGVTAIRVYYKIPEFILPGIYQVMNLVNFYRAHTRGLELLGNFSPDIVHSHILTREAAMGYLFSKKYDVPHVISEHWSRYFPENGSYKGWIRKWITQHVVGKASAIVAVSEVLKHAMIERGLFNKHYFVVPNVVDPPALPHAPAKAGSSLKTFLHVSCFDNRAKNISGLLEAIAELSGRRSDFCCLLAGEGPDMAAMQQLAAALGLSEERVSFLGLVNEQELLTLYRKADFCVLPSRYETFGTVLVESLICGTPIVSTAVGIAPEVVTEETGILIPVNDHPALVNAIDEMLDQSETYDRESIRKSVSDRYTPQHVASRISEIYEMTGVERKEITDV